VSDDSDGSLTDFLNSDDSVDDPTVKIEKGDETRKFTLVDPSNPLNMMNALGAVLGSIVGVFAIGFLQFVQAVAAFFRGIYAGVSEFVTTLFIDWLITPYTLSIRGAYLMSLEEYGLAALPVSFAVALSSLFVLSVTIYWIRRRGF